MLCNDPFSQNLVYRIFNTRADHETSDALQYYVEIFTRLLKSLVLYDVWVLDKISFIVQFV